MLFSLALLLAAPLVSAHGAVTSYAIGGKTYPGYEGFSPVAGAQIIQRQWPDYNPIMSVSDAKMTCNGGTSAPLSAEIAAGTNITAFWKQWTHAQGPVMVWMYACPNGFSACDGKGKGWFKIDEMGMWGGKLNSDNWGTAIVLKELKWSSKIPANLKAGDYLIRHELLALHQSNTPQFYVSNAWCCHPSFQYQRLPLFWLLFVFIVIVLRGPETCFANTSFELSLTRNDIARMRSTQSHWFR